MIMAVLILQNTKTIHKTRNQTSLKNYLRSLVFQIFLQNNRFVRDDDVNGPLFGGQHRRYFVKKPMSISIAERGSNFPTEIFQFFYGTGVAKISHDGFRTLFNSDIFWQIFLPQLRLVGVNDGLQFGIFQTTFMKVDGFIQQKSFVLH